MRFPKVYGDSRVRRKYSGNRKSRKRKLDCDYRLLSFYVCPDMLRFVEEEAERLGLKKADYLRMIIREKMDEVMKNGYEG